MDYIRSRAAQLQDHTAPDVEPWRPEYDTPKIDRFKATVLTITKGTFHGSIVMRGGKIVDAGERVMAPAAAKIMR
jgi:hypothetical protein